MRLFSIAQRESGIGGVPLASAYRDTSGVNVMATTEPGNRALQATRRITGIADIAERIFGSEGDRHEWYYQQVSN